MNVHENARLTPRGREHIVGLAARNSAMYFTRWYPQYRKARYGTQPVNALPTH
jgi:hypothetical protein